MKPSRRTILAGAAVGGVALGVGALPFLVDGREERMSPAEARHRGVALQSFTADEAALLGRLGDVVLPGADKAGIVHFVDHHVTVPAVESLLMIRYLDVPPPYADFYRAGLAALDASARAAHQRGFTELPAAAAGELVGTLGRQQPSGWRGPPSQLLYFLVRSDAVDVVYGTMAGFDRLGIPYMAHIEPDQPW